MTRRVSTALVILLTASAQAFAGGVLCHMESLTDDEQVESFAAELRAEGPAGFEKAFDYLEKLNEQLADIELRGAKSSSSNQEEIASRERADAARKKMERIVDLVAGQRNAHVSKLYWYTDLEEAKAAAEESGKPILSLRLLGKLTDEYSCANSRFFRTALYSNKEISDYLRDHFVLHWQSVRPVPRITVDFGDGRKLERTITGNSAHYVLDATGRPLEALPGLYGPKAFKQWLVRSKELADRLMLVSNREYIATLLIEHHANRRNAIDAALEADLKTHAPELPRSVNNEADEGRVGKPTARKAAVRAVSKTVAEAPLLASILPSDEVLQRQDDELWKRIAAAHADEAKLDQASVELMRRENPTAAEAGVRAESKRRQEDPLVRLVRSFEESMALDTVKNEYLLHRKIHEWFVNQDAPREIEAFNEKVYAELFLTPSSDPWLGLAPADAYTALDGGGLTAAP
jgi:hypothetical protein